MHATHFPLHCSTLLMSLNLMHPEGWWEGHGGGAGSELHDTVEFTVASPHTSSHTKHRRVKLFVRFNVCKYAYPPTSQMISPK